MGEQRGILRGLSWERYLQSLEALPASQGSCLTYDDEVLEISVPLADNEFSERLIERFILTLVELIGLRIKTKKRQIWTWMRLSPERAKEEEIKVWGLRFAVLMNWDVIATSSVRRSLLTLQEVAVAASGCHGRGYP